MINLTILITFVSIWFENENFIMKIFNTAMVPKLDEYTVKNEPISSIDLMERTASAMTFEIMARWRRSVPVVVFAGPGNNGGDALAVARMLREEGYRVEVFLFNPLHKLSANCAKNRERLLELGEVALTEVASEFMPPTLKRGMLVVDGLFGTGLKSPLSGGYASVVQYINASDAAVVSLDIPSGLFGENNTDNIGRNIICADLTLTCQFPKLSFFFAENEPYVGEWVILDIGLHPEILARTESKIRYTEAEDAAALLRPRKRFAGKYEAGSVLLVAGAYGMMGAAVMAAESSVRSGAGLVTVHVPRCGCSVLQQCVPEALISADTDENRFTQLQIRHPYGAVAVGPGLGRDALTEHGLGLLFAQLKRPAVIDADALNYLAGHPEQFGKLPVNTILTPHVREFDRMFGKSDTAYERLVKAQEAARRFNVIIVLKGANSAVILPKGEIYFNGTGNPGMATAGSGDVLTGVIAALLAQGYPTKDAAVLGVFVHGLAGDIALENGSVESVSARDITAHLGAAFRRLHEIRRER